MGVEKVIYKKREKSAELVLLQLLKNRMTFSREVRIIYLNAVKGFKGECVFDKKVEIISCDCFVLHDVLLKINRQIFQIDTLVITGNIIYLYEVKNYEGKYIYLDGKLYKESLEYEINNPYIQVQRAQSLLRQWLRQMGFRFTVEAFVAFVHPRFTLYTLQQEVPLLLPHMLEEHFEKISRSNKPLNNLHQQLAEKLIEMHLTKSPYNNLLEYKYEDLKKGVICANCDKFVDKVIGQTCICDECNNKESTVAAIIRHAEEYRRLFPNRKLTTTALQQWCGGQFTAYQIRYTLKKHYQKINSGRWTVFV